MILRSSNFRDPGRMDVARHRGVDIVVLASSFHRNNKNTRSGIYELAYSIHRLLGEEEAPPPGGEAIPVPGHPRRGMVVAVPETVMWNYNRLPMPDQDRNLVAKDEVYPLPGTARISLFNLNRSNEDKHTSYVATNVDGDDGGHWALEDTDTFPDGDYLLTVKARNIGHSNGIGNDPDLNEAVYYIGVRVETAAGARFRTLQFIRM